MLGVRVTITRFVDEHQPGWVECALTDLSGKVWLFHEKVPIVSADGLDANSSYPKPGIIACEIVSKRLDAVGQEIVTISTERPWHVQATGGEVHFDVIPGELVQIE